MILARFSELSQPVAKVLSNSPDEGGVDGHEAFRGLGCCHADRG
jgi:hypothetical protein